MHRRDEELVAGADEAAARDGRHVRQVKRGHADDYAVREADECAVDAEQREQLAARTAGREAHARADHYGDHLVEQKAAAFGATATSKAHVCTVRVYCVLYVTMYSTVE